MIPPALSIFLLILGGIAALASILNFSLNLLREEGKNRAKRISQLLAIAAIVLLTAGVLAPRLSPAPTPIPTPTQIAKQTTTATLQASPTPYGELVLNDPLVDNSQGYKWDETPSHCTFIDHAYHVSNVAYDDTWECNSVSSKSDFGNIAYQVTMTITRGMQKQEGGIFFRFTPNTQSGYYYLFDIEGDFELGMVRNEQGTTLVKGHSDDFINGFGKANQIAVRARGSTIDLFINGHLIKTVSDHSFADGQIGMGLGAGANADAAFTDAKVWLLS